MQEQCEDTRDSPTGSVEPLHDCGEQGEQSSCAVTSYFGLLQPQNIPGLESSSHPRTTLGLGRLVADSQGLPPPRDLQVPKMQLPGGARTLLDVRAQQAHEIIQ